MLKTLLIINRKPTKSWKNKYVTKLGLMNLKNRFKVEKKNLN